LLSVELPYSNKCYVTVLGTSITKKQILATSIVREWTYLIVPQLLRFDIEDNLA
jgi:hypothetical protein